MVETISTPKSTHNIRSFHYNILCVQALYFVIESLNLCRGRPKKARTRRKSEYNLK